jgi:S1-C subfamily serine protease
MANIGNAWLHHFRVTLDYGARAVYFFQRKPFRPASLTGQYGLTLKPDRGKMFVRDVAEGTPAASASVKPRDEVVDVDGVAALPLANQWPRLLDDPVPGERHALRLRRDGKVFTIELTAAPIA